MADKLFFDPNNQSVIATTAVQLAIDIEPSLPRVPWLSNSGQQEAFQKTIGLMTKSIEQMNADDDAKDAATFWALSYLYANNRGFRLSTASVKNWGGIYLSPIVTAFVQWVGSNIHPGQVIAEEIMRRKMREVMDSDLPGKIQDKIMKIAFIKNISPEEASNLFQELFSKASKKFMSSGLSEEEADEKAVNEILSLEITE
ncbi:MAG: hypothetical protein EPO31_13920 [Gammaproteobacteria bacterium]|nr:MAG: hypothetical protein EPO31_13920 [Gammaproteobacteria bacterium]